MSDTPRPLSKQEREQPYCSRCKINHDFPCEQDDVIEKHADSLLAQWSNLECLRYLRNKIQKLKEAR